MGWYFTDISFKFKQILSNSLPIGFMVCWWVQIFHSMEYIPEWDFFAHAVMVGYHAKNISGRSYPCLIEDPPRRVHSILIWLLLYSNSVMFKVSMKTHLWFVHHISSLKEWVATDFVWPVSCHIQLDKDMWTDTLKLNLIKCYTHATWSCSILDLWQVQ